MVAPVEGSLWFEEAIREVLPELLGVARRLSRSQEDAEDLVAEAIAKAWLRRDTLRERERFAGWIMRILTNLFFSQHRFESHHPHEPLNTERDFSLFERLHQPFLMWWSTPEKEFLDQLLREDLVRAIDGLSEPFRIVVVLADVEGLSYAEIAASLAVPVGTVRSRLARGRALLQKALWDHACHAGLRSGVLERRSSPHE
jgi:RNA polymerase sigma-70 factor (ECF subfamily)